MRVAFYAPAKPPDHEVPSGDRTMARLLVAALERGGHEVTLASRLRTYSADPAAGVRERLEREASVEARRLLDSWKAKPAAQPECWFCYHPYYKSPDWIGPPLCQTLGIPYVTAEASFAAKRDVGPWVSWQDAAVVSIRSAAINFCFTEQDAAGVETVTNRRGRMVRVAPFIDCRTPVRLARPSGSGEVRLITVAMMRPGVKLDSYRMLGCALADLAGPQWTLTIIGDGPQREEVSAAFRAIAPERISWRGMLSAEDVQRELAAADIFVWPGCGEAYGLAYLEAQAEGLPVVAQATAGVPEVVCHGVTGLLTPEGDIAELRDAVRRLICDSDLRARMGDAASAFVREERSLTTAAQTLNAVLTTLSIHSLRA
jgi:glycosyltransferase involved in cell wall biosynthesis